MDLILIKEKRFKYKGFDVRLATWQDKRYPPETILHSLSMGMLGYESTYEVNPGVALGIWKRIIKMLISAIKKRDKFKTYTKRELEKYGNER